MPELGEKEGLVRHSLIVPVILALAGLNAFVSAQTAPLVSVEIALDIDSGLVSNRLPGFLGPQGPSAAVVFSTTVAVGPDAPWMRLHFGDVQLAGSRAEGTASFLRLTSVEDGGVQRLDNRSLPQWQYASAYFNGHRVLVELLAYPETGPNRVTINLATVGIRNTAPESICGPTDDRVGSANVRVARIVPVGCTGYLINDGQHCFLTAGHCTGPSMTTVEFNVPASDADGTINCAAPNDQYPIDPASVQFGDDGGGVNDWAYFGAFANSNTLLTPFEAQGSAFMLATTVPAADFSTIFVTGYGVDSNDPTLSQTLQADFGTYDDVTPTVINYDNLDTEGGSSGSPVYKINPTLVIGIHVLGGCDIPPDGSNTATRIDNAGLQTALANPKGICACGSPAAGSCLNSSVSPGCNDTSCCTVVCASAPTCCQTAWDQSCVNLALALCSDCGDPGAGSCFEINGTPSCDNAACCLAVCAVDASCCEFAWSILCKEMANEMCGNCGQPGAGNCYVANGTPGCDDIGCCRIVCEQAPNCCEIAWDEACKAMANDICGDCGVLAAGNCYEANGTPGCQNADCCRVICALDPTCCEIAWDELCRQAAADVCGDCGDAGAGSCYAGNGTPGCNDADCCAIVCAIDPVCCNIAWENNCIPHAWQFCGSPNDDASAANPIATGADEFYATHLATSDGPSPCNIGADIWYAYTADLTGDVTVRVCCSNFDTVIAAYNGCGGPVDIGDLINCNDDSCGDGLTSQLTFFVVTGNCYTIQVGGFAGAVGQGNIELIPAIVGTDLCEDAPEIVNGQTPFSTFCAEQDDGPNDCGLAPGSANAGGGAGSDIWYDYNSSFTGLLTVSLCGSDYDTILAVYDGCGCPAQVAATIGCNDDSCGLASEVEVPVVSGACYKIQVAGFDFDAGEGVLTISKAPACPWDDDGDGFVGITDFLNLLAVWGTDPGGPPDFDGDGDVGITDFLELLANWGPCP